MRITSKRWVLTLLVIITITSFIMDVHGQQRNKNKRRRKPQKQKKPKKPPPTEGGLWVPREQRRPNTKRRRKQQAKNRNQNKAQGNNRGGNTNFEDIISPPLYRSDGGPDLQEPSWAHCVHHIQVDERWASFMSPGYPRNISGQIQCTWIVHGIRGMRLRLSFNDLDLQDGNGGRCGNQFVDLIDMELLNSQGKSCGSMIPGDYVSVGRSIRVDIQGDTTIQPHKGFQAAVKSVSLSVPPGRRQRSTMYHGLPTTSRRPPVTRRTAPRRIETTTTRKTITTTRARKRGQILYGPNMNQPNSNSEIKTITTGTPDTTIVLYAVIGVFCFLVVLTAIGFIFRKQLYAQYKACKRKRKDKKAEADNPENETPEKRKSDIDRGSENAAFSRGRFELPESVASTPTLDGRRRRSVVFEDEVLAGLVREPLPRNISADNLEGDSWSEASKSQQSLSILPQSDVHGNFQGWNYPKGEPIYEDDAMSVQSFSSVRSANRHPDHVVFKQKKIIEKNKALLGEEDKIYEDHSDPIYDIGAPMPYPVMPPLFNPMMGRDGMHQMVPQYEPRLGYLMMPQQHNQFGRGPPTMPIGYHEPQCFPSHHPHVDRTSYQWQDAPIAQHQRSQDDINLHHSRGDLNGPEMNGILRPAKSMTDLNTGMEQHSPQSNRVRSTQSMAELPLDSTFLQRRLERSQSFRL